MSARRWFWAAALLYAVAWGCAAQLLPSRVPMHFTSSGGVDRWAGRGEALILFAVVGAVLGLLFLVLATYADRMPIEFVNTPHKSWWTATPERTAALRRRTEQATWAVGAATMTLLAAIEVCVVRAARSDQPHLDWLFAVCFVAYLAFIVVWLIRSFRRSATRIDE